MSKYALIQHLVDNRLVSHIVRLDSILYFQPQGIGGCGWMSIQGIDESWLLPNDELAKVRLLIDEVSLEEEVSWERA